MLHVNISFLMLTSASGGLYVKHLQLCHVVTPCESRRIRNTSLSCEGCDLGAEKIVIVAEPYASASAKHQVLGQCKLGVENPAVAQELWIV